MRATRRAGDRRIGIKAALPALMGVLLLAGCHSGNAPLPLLTGHQGGLLPGMILPETAPPVKSTAADGFSGVQDQILPDGQILRHEYIAGVILSETWFSSLRQPERSVIYMDGKIPVEISEYGTNGKLLRHTVFFPGTPQPQRYEEYSDGQHISRFSTFWPNGNLRIISEADVVTSSGLVNRVREWYANGYPKSLIQTYIIRDTAGTAIDQQLHGEQTTWDDFGRVTSDQIFDHGRLAHDLVVERNTSSH
jgi:hypothetical protein